MENLLAQDKRALDRRRLADLIERRRVVKRSWEVYIWLKTEIIAGYTVYFLR